MGKIDHIILYGNYSPGSATANRLLGYVKGYGKIGVKVTFVLYTRQDISISPLHNVEVIVVKEENKSISKILNIINTYRIIIKILKEKYTNTSCIHFYGVPLFGLFFSSKKYNVFYEQTEYPYLPSKNFKFSLLSIVNEFIIKRTTGLLVISESLKDYYHKKGVKNIEIINMFVDSERFQNIPIKKGIKYIAYCGTVTNYKDGVSDLIKAFASIHKKHSDYYLLIIGGFAKSSQNDKIRIEKLINDEGVKDYVIFTGKTPPEKIPELLANADILTLARPNNIQAKYGFPTKLGEYLCTGRPVVITDVGDIKKFFRNKINAIITKPDCPKDFANGILFLIENPDLASSIGENGKKLSKSVFSNEIESLKAFHFMQYCINI